MAQNCWAQCSHLNGSILHATYVDDSGLQFIAKCGKLKTLWLQFNSQITNTGLKKLSHIANNLEELVLGSTHITDDGVDDLARIKRLRSLHLNCLPISNMGLKQLEFLEKPSEIKCTGN